MITIIILFLLLICIVIYFYLQSNKQAEHFDSNEAIANIASLYNKDMMIMDNAKFTGNVEIQGSFNMIPKGIIVAWYNNEVPDGWSVCDGTNGTPDLRNRFIYGGSNNNVTIGGNATVTLTTNELPKHSHQTIDSSFKDNLAGYLFGPQDNTYSGGGDDRFGRTSDASTAFRTSTEGNGNPFSILPPYITLRYIMKL